MSKELWCLFIGIDRSSTKRGYRTASTVHGQWTRLKGHQRWSGLWLLACWIVCRVLGTGCMVLQREAGCSTAEGSRQLFLELSIIAALHWSSKYPVSMDILLCCLCRLASSVNGDDTPWMFFLTASAGPLAPRLFPATQARCWKGRGLKQHLKKNVNLFCQDSLVVPRQEFCLKTIGNWCG